MQAITMSTPGDPDVLKLQEVAQPVIVNPTDVLIKLKGAGINPIDTKIRSRGTFYPEQMPAILGCDGAGIVHDVGSQVTNFKPGEAVYFYYGGLGKKNTGNYAEWAVVPEHLLTLKPSCLSFLEAAAVPLALITAWESLYDRAKLKSAQKVLIHGGAGGVGHLAIQLAKLEGAVVYTTVGTPDKARLARKLGADETIIYTQTDFVQAILELTGGEGVDIAFDTVGGNVFFETVKAVKVYGDLVTLLEPKTEISNLKLARQRNLRISLELMLTPALEGLKADQIHQTGILKQGANWFEQGKLKIHLSQSFPLKEASTAHRQIEIGSTTGKIALEIE